MAERPRRRRTNGRQVVGEGPGIRVWMDPVRPGLHFGVYDPPSSFEIAGTWRMDEAGLVLVELTLKSRSPGARVVPTSLGQLVERSESSELPLPHITSTTLRSASVPELERRTRAALRVRSEQEADMELAMEEAREQGLNIPALYQVPKAARNILRHLGEGSFRPGRQGYPFGLYEWVATEYLRLARRKSHGVLKELAERASERLGWEVSASNARDWVHRARELGLLSKGVPGKAKAEPGPALRSEFH